MANGQTKKLRVGDTLAKGAGLLVSDIPLFSALAAICYSPLFAWTLIAEPTILDPQEDIGELLASTTAWLLLQLLVAAAAAHAAVQKLQQRNARLGACLSAGLDRYLTVVGIMAVQICVIAIPLGFAAVIRVLAPVLGFVAVGAAFFAAMCLVTLWWVAIPATIVERLDIARSLARSAELTVGNLGNLFRLILILTVLAVAVQLAIGVVSGAMGTAAIMPARAGQFLWAISTAAIATLNGVVMGAAYHDLKTIKDGTNPIASSVN